MIRYLKNSQVDRVQWDKCIAEACNGNIYGYSWYLDVINEGWDCLVMDDYSAVMPVTKGRKYLMDYIYPPYFAQQLGVFSKRDLNEELCISFLNAIPLNYRFVEMNLNSASKWIPEIFSVKKNSNYVLNLNNSYDEIRNNFSDNHNRNIKKAQKNKLTIFKSGNADVVIDMFRKNRGKYIQNLQDEHYNTFRKLILATASRERMKTWIVNDADGLPCAGAVFFESHLTGILIFSAVNKKGKELSAMHLLIDEYIRDNQKILMTLDFEGSNDVELARFYKGFGSTEYVYLQIRKNQLPAPWRWFKN